MPHFTLSISNQGPTLIALIGVSSARSAALTAAGQQIPGNVQITALVDTGASNTCIDPSVLQRLVLTPTGRTSVNTPSTGNTAVEVDQYDVSLIIPPATVHQIPLFVHTLPVICSELVASQGFHALIGRDILAQCVLFYNGSAGTFTLAF